MSETNTDGWHEIGTHVLRFEAPDIVHMRFIGDLTLADVGQLLKTDDAFPKLEKGYFALGDVSAVGRPNLEMLKSNEILKQMQNYRAFVYYRAQFQHRTVIEIVQKVSRALNLSISSKPLVAFATEVEARAWIDEYRQGTI